MEDEDVREEDMDMEYVCASRYGDEDVDTDMGRT
jgi:hypothetical protein